MVLKHGEEGGWGHINLFLHLRDVWGSEWIRGWRVSKNVLHKRGGSRAVMIQSYIIPQYISYPMVYPGIHILHILNMYHPHPPV